MLCVLRQSRGPRMDDYKVYGQVADFLLETMTEAGAAEKGDEFAFVDFERDVVDGGDRGVAEVIVARDVLRLDERGS